MAGMQCFMTFFNINKDTFIFYPPFLTAGKAYNFSLIPT